MKSIVPGAAGAGVSFFSAGFEPKRLPAGRLVVPEFVVVGAVVVVEAAGFPKRPPPPKRPVPPVDAEEVPAAGCVMGGEVVAVELSAGLVGSPNKPPVELPPVAGANGVGEYSVCHIINFIHIPVDVVVLPKTARPT